jgi:predicted oxidoreductase
LLRVLLKEDNVLVQMLVGNRVENHIVNTSDLREGWHHLCVTCNGTNVCIYLDQQLIYRHEQTGAMSGVANATCIGAGSVFPQWYHLQGSLEEIRVYDRALNDSEVVYSYVNRIPMDTQGLVLWFSFDHLDLPLT